MIFKEVTSLRKQIELLFEAFWLAFGLGAGAAGVASTAAAA